MSTVTLSQPAWAYISAEKALGMASHPFTTAFPAFQASLTLFGIARPHLLRPAGGGGGAPHRAHPRGGGRRPGAAGGGGGVPPPPGPPRPPAPSFWGAPRN